MCDGFGHANSRYGWFGKSRQKWHFDKMYNEFIVQYFLSLGSNINAEANIIFAIEQLNKILTNTKKYIRFSKKKETEVELLLHFCSELKKIKPSMQGNVSLLNIFNRQIDLVRKTMMTLHEDLQYDYELALNKLL